MSTNLDDTSEESSDSRSDDSALLFGGRSGAEARSGRGDRVNKLLDQRESSARIRGTRFANVSRLFFLV